MALRHVRSPRALLPYTLLLVLFSSSLPPFTGPSSWVPLGGGVGIRASVATRLGLAEAAAAPKAASAAKSAAAKSAAAKTAAASESAAAAAAAAQGILASDALELLGLRLVEALADGHPGCIADPAAEAQRTFPVRSPNSFARVAACEKKGDLPRRVCSSGELAAFVRSLNAQTGGTDPSQESTSTSSGSSGGSGSGKGGTREESSTWDGSIDGSLLDPINCNGSSPLLGCLPGFASPVATPPLNTTSRVASAASAPSAFPAVSASASAESFSSPFAWIFVPGSSALARHQLPPAPLREDPPSACCAGFFCPAGLACMIPCPAGSFCPSPVTPRGFSCSPYAYPPVLHSTTNMSRPQCGGADQWGAPAQATGSSTTYGSFNGSFLPLSPSSAPSLSSSSALTFSPASSSSAAAAAASYSSWLPVLACPEGFFCPDAGTIKPCPPSHICPAGSTAPSRVTNGSQMQSSDQFFLALCLTLLTLAVALLLPPCFLLSVRPLERARRATAEARSPHRLLPSPRFHGRGMGGRGGSRWWRWWGDWRGGKGGGRLGAVGGGGAVEGRRCCGSSGGGAGGVGSGGGAAVGAVWWRRVVALVGAPVRRVCGAKLAFLGCRVHHAFVPLSHPDLSESRASSRTSSFSFARCHPSCTSLHSTPPVHRTPPHSTLPPLASQEGAGKGDEGGRTGSAEGERPLESGREVLVAGLEQLTSPNPVIMGGMPTSLNPNPDGHGGMDVGMDVGVGVGVGMGMGAGVPYGYDQGLLESGGGGGIAGQLQHPLQQQQQQLGPGMGLVASSPAATSVAAGGTDSLLLDSFACAATPAAAAAAAAAVANLPVIGAVSPFALPTTTPYPHTTPQTIPSQPSTFPLHTPASAPPALSFPSPGGNIQPRGAEGGRLFGELGEGLGPDGSAAAAAAGAGAGAEASEAAGAAGAEAGEGAGTWARGGGLGAHSLPLRFPGLEAAFASASSAPSPDEFLRLVEFQNNMMGTSALDLRAGAGGSGWGGAGGGVAGDGAGGRYAGGGEEAGRGGGAEPGSLEELFNEAVSCGASGLLQGQMRRMLRVDLVNVSIAMPASLPSSHSPPSPSSASSSDSTRSAPHRATPLAVTCLHAKLHPGRITSVLGPTAGRSALLEVLSGQPSSSVVVGGHIAVEGAPAAMASYRPLIGYMAAGSALPCPFLTVDEYLTLHAHMR
ncbi:hypothetical protein CLOP_g12823, partial [Closterium sp. NIES-67]